VFVIIVSVGTTTDWHLQRVHCWFANGDSSQGLA